MDAPLAPGDRVVVGGEPRRVETVLRCSEEVAGRVTGWRWAFLDDGALLEVAPAGTAVYRGHRVFERSQPFYQQVVAQDGALVRFEARVRAGRVEAEPTYLTVDRREYVVVATGAARVDRRDGPPPALAAWRALDDDPAQNVWFHLRELDGTGRAVGLWTTALCLSFGEGVQTEQTA